MLTAEASLALSEDQPVEPDRLAELARRPVADRDLVPDDRAFRMPRAVSTLGVVERSREHRDGIVIEPGRDQDPAEPDTGSEGTRVVRAEGTAPLGHDSLVPGDCL